MTLESRLNRVEIIHAGGRNACSLCGRLPNGNHPPNTPEYVRTRILKSDDGSPMLKCTNCGAHLLFQFAVPDGTPLPRLNRQSPQSDNGIFQYDFSNDQRVLEASP